jgi:hypothetical protein
VAIAFPARRKPVNTRIKTKNFLIAFSPVSISAVFDGIAKSQNHALPEVTGPGDDLKQFAFSRLHARPSIFIIYKNEPVGGSR